MSVLPEEMDDDIVDAWPDKTDANINASQLENDNCLGTETGLVTKAN